jgi:DNA-binding LacI/PurR family transcriptional regulator
MVQPFENRTEEDDVPASPVEKRVTIRDIAARTGVSHVTVSYALRGMSRVSMALRERICDEARKMGYRPDPMLRALSTYRRAQHGETRIQSALGWLSCWDLPEAMHTRKEFHAYWLGVKTVAENNGYRLESLAPNDRLSVGRIQQIMRARNIRGVLIPPPQSTFSQDLSCFDWSKFAVVKFGHAFDKLPVNLVTSAHTHNAALAVRKMTERGYRRVGFVSSEYSIRRTLFLSGVLLAQTDLAERDRVSFLSLSEADVKSGDSARLRAWIEKEKPDAILSNLSELPAMVRQAGYDIPGDIGFAALSVHDGNADAGIDQKPFEIGKAACELVVSLILYGGWGYPEAPREVLIEGAWVDGSMLPLRASAKAA